MENKELEGKLMSSLMNLKNCKIHKAIHMSEFTHNQRLVMFILHDLEKKGKISLRELRNRMKLAPSTITPIITSLENDGYIERNIDPNDRRNIFLQLSKKGIEYTNKTHNAIENAVKDYINYMGKEDTEELIRLLTKSAEYFKERGKINEKSI